MSKLGVIVAGGKGSRWGGYFKELLPVGNRTWLINRVIDSMILGGAEKIIVVTTQEKINTHMKHLAGYGNIFYVLQKEPELWGAMYSSLEYAGDTNFFAMPDTFFPLENFTYKLEGHFAIGVHKTKMPERFGIFYNEKIVDKLELPPDEWFDAWGSLVWSKRVAEYWLKVGPKDYTDAINIAMENFGYQTFPMSYYYDMSTWEDYVKFVEKFL